MTRTIATALGPLAVVLFAPGCTTSSNYPLTTTVEPAECSTVTIEGAPPLTLTIAQSLIGKATVACLVGSGGNPVTLTTLPKERTEEPGWAELVANPGTPVTSSSIPGMPDATGECVENTGTRIYLKAGTNWYQARNLQCSGANSG